MRFLFKVKPAVHPTIPASLNPKVVNIRGVRSDWVTVSAEGVGIGIIERPNTQRACGGVKYRMISMGPAMRLLALCRPPPRMTPADFGLKSLIVERELDNVKVFFGPHDDIIEVVATP
jgi:hypothetical protein